MAHRLPLKDIRFIADFAAFARSKGDERYDYGLPNACALAQFAEKVGLTTKGLPCEVYHDGANWQPTFCSPFEEALNPADGAFTFSALADRLEALIADAPVVLSS